MRVRLLVGLSGPAYSLGGGDEAEFPQAEAIRLIDAGYAVPVSEKRTETTAKPPAPEARHPLDHDGDGRPGGSLPALDRDLDDLRQQYEELFGSAPDGRWGAPRLQSAIDEKLAE